MKVMDVPERARLLAERVSGNAESADIVRGFLERRRLMYEPAPETRPEVDIPGRYYPEPNLGDWEYPVSAGMMQGYPIPVSYGAPVSVEAPAPVPALDPVKDAARRIMAVENSKGNPDGGWNAKEGRWYPHGSVEGGADTIAYGIKLSNGTPEAKLALKQGYLTDEQAEHFVDTLARRYYDAAKGVYDGKYGAGEWDKLSDKSQSILVDYSYNPGLAKFPKLMEGFHSGNLDLIRKNYKRYSGGKELGRNKVLLDELDTLENEYPIFRADGGNIYRKGGKHKVKKGDSWISIANELGVGLPDLLAWNGIDPESREALPAIHPGQEVYSSNPYNLPASGIVAEAPKNYADYGDTGRNMITNYALAVDQGSIGFNQVPSEYQPAVYQRGITLKTDKAADDIFRTGLNSALFLSDPIGYSAGLAAQKGLAYANDAVSGRNEYGADDILGYTPVMGMKYSQEHPMRSLAADVATGAIGGAAIRNVGNIINNARQAAQNAASTAGMERQVLSYPSSSGQSFGSVYKSGVKGSGKTGTVRSARGRSGYAPNSSAKGVFSNEASGTPASVTWTTPDAVLPIDPIPFSGPGVPPVILPPNVTPNVSVKTPERHIYEQQAFSRWQLPNPTNEYGEYVPGTGLMYIRGEAPIGSAIPEQALTRETTEFGTGYVPRRSVYVPGEISGDPTNIYSGLGLIYGSENPGSLIIGDYKSGGKIHIKPENRGKFTALKKRTGHSASWFKAHGTPAQKKMAVFALNAKKWKHGEGGLLDRYSEDSIREALAVLRKK